MARRVRRAACAALIGDAVTVLGIERHLRGRRAAVRQRSRSIRAAQHGRHGDDQRPASWSTRLARERDARARHGDRDVHVHDHRTGTAIRRRRTFTVTLTDTGVTNRRDEHDRWRTRTLRPAWPAMRARPATGDDAAVLSGTINYTLGEDAIRLDHAVGGEHGTDQARRHRDIDGVGRGQQHADGLRDEPGGRGVHDRGVGCDQQPERREHGDLHDDPGAAGEASWHVAGL